MVRRLIVNDPQLKYFVAAIFQFVVGIQRCGDYPTFELVRNEHFVFVAVVVAIPYFEVIPCTNNRHSPLDSTDTP